VESKKYESEFLDGIRATLDEPETTVVCCDFSRGLWSGCNGIRTLVLTDQNLRVYMAGIAFTAHPDPQRTRQEVIPITTVRQASLHRRRAPARPWRGGGDEART
jgi:hypothetical protein